MMGEYDAGYENCIDSMVRQMEDMQFRIDSLHRENAKLRELVRDVVLLAGVNGCDVTKMQLHAHGGDWRTVWERMRELGVVE